MTTFERVDIFNTIENILTNHFGFHKPHEHTLLSSEMDEFDRVGFEGYLEAGFGVEIKSSESQEWNTVGDVVRWIEMTMNRNYHKPSKSLSWWQDRVKNLDMTISIVHGSIVVDFFDSRMIECKDEEELEEVVRAIETLSGRME